MAGMNRNYRLVVLPAESALVARPCAIFHGNVFVFARAKMSENGNYFDKDPLYWRSRHHWGCTWILKASRFPGGNDRQKGNDKGTSNNMHSFVGWRAMTAGRNGNEVL